jgi:5-methylcytosine-specific restriction enzyme A
MSTYKQRRFYKQAHWRDTVRKQVLYNSNYRCAHCQADLSNAGKLAQIHHIVELKRAPHRGFDLSNLEPLCIRCHNNKHDRGNRSGMSCGVDGSPRDSSHPWNSFARK